MELPAVISAQKNDGPSLLEGEIPEDQGGPLDDAPPLSDEEIVAILEGYRMEATYARIAGPSSRDLTWLQHLDLYWNRWDFSKKAPWQAREVMPEFPQYVDRFAASMRMALVAQPEFYTVSADNDQEGALAYVIRQFMNVQLRRIGRNPTGHRVDFSAIFEEAMKMGALSIPIFKVGYKDDGEEGYTSLEIVDPYNFWFDPTGRNLYRIHREELDLHELRALAELRDGDAELFNRDALNSALVEGAGYQAQFRAEREKRTGTGQWAQSNRKPIIIDEYLCDIIDYEGRIRARNVLCVVANNKWLIRGPEKNPFEHGKDWMVASPIITVPSAPYGRSYAENFAQLTRTFNEMTNLILDGILATTMKVFAVVPGYLEDPSQIDDGIAPNAMLRLIEGIENEQALKSVDMGSLDPQAFQVWQMLKKELQEGAAFNDMTLGNSAPKGRTSATEIDTVSDNSSQYMRAIANNIETLLLEPTLDIIWKTSLQFLSKRDKEVELAVGPQWFQTLLRMKKDFLSYRVTFVCRGITSLLARKQKLQEFLQFLQICTQNPEMAQVLTSTWPAEKLFAYLAMLMDVDVNQLQGTPQQQQMQQIQNQSKQKAALQQQQQTESMKANAKANAEYSKDSRMEVLKHLLAHRVEQRQAAKMMQGQPVPAQQGEENGQAPAPGA